MFEDDYGIEMDSDTIDVDFDSIDDGTTIVETDTGEFDNLVLE